MENTSCGENCCFVKAGMCKSCKECPNYVETVVENKKTGEVGIRQDCVPKRLSIDNEDQKIRDYGVIAAVEVLRDEVNDLKNLYSQLIENSRRLVIDAENEKLKTLVNKDVDVKFLEDK